MIYLFHKQIEKAIKDKLNIDINSIEYSKTIFSVDSIEIENPLSLPFDKTYKGNILIFKNGQPLYTLKYIVKSHENIPEQSDCFISINETLQASLEISEE